MGGGVTISMKKGYINSENLNEINRLEKTYESISDWQGSWCRDERERRRAIESRWEDSCIVLDKAN